MHRLKSKLYVALVILGAIFLIALGVATMIHRRPLFGSIDTQTEVYDAAIAKNISIITGTPGDVPDTEEVVLLDTSNPTHFVSSRAVKIIGVGVASVLIVFLAKNTFAERISRFTKYFSIFGKYISKCNEHLPAFIKNSPVFTKYLPILAKAPHRTWSIIFLDCTLVFLLCIFGIYYFFIRNEPMQFHELEAFIASLFIPIIFDEETHHRANQVIMEIFSLSKEYLFRNNVITKGIYDKVILTIKQASNRNFESVVERISRLDVLPEGHHFSTFGDKTKSVVFYCGPKSQNMLCEICKVEHGVSFLWKVFLYNSGNELEYHPSYSFGPRKLYSPVLIYEGEPKLVTPHWVYTLINSDELEYTNFYPKLFGEFILSSETYRYFINTQVSGSCPYSLYHVYFSFHLGADVYQKIFLAASVYALQKFMQSKNIDFVRRIFLEKLDLGYSPLHAILRPYHYAIYIKKNTHNSYEKYHLIRWSIQFIVSSCKYLFQLKTKSISQDHGLLVNDLERFLDEFDTLRPRIDFPLAFKNIGPTFNEKLLIEVNTKPPLLDTLWPVSPIELGYCELPNLQADSSFPFSDFKQSIIDFLEKEISHGPCFSFESNALPAYIYSFTLKILDILDSYSYIKTTERMSFIHQYCMRLFVLFDIPRKTPTYHLAIVFNRIIMAYKKLLLPYLEQTIGSKEKFKILEKIFTNLGLKLYSKQNINLLGKSIEPDSGETIMLFGLGDLNRQILEILFQSEVPTLIGLQPYFDISTLQYAAWAGSYITDHIKMYKDCSMLCTVIGNVPTTPNKTVPNLILDAYYYNLIEILKPFYSPIGPMSCTIKFSWWTFIPGDINEYDMVMNKLIVEYRNSKTRLIDLMTTTLPLGSAVYYLSYLQENKEFILTERGRHRLYYSFFQESVSENAEMKALAKNALRYFLIKKAKELSELKPETQDEQLKLLAVYQIAINRLTKTAGLQFTSFDAYKDDVDRIFKQDHEAIGAFLKLHYLILSNGLSMLRWNHSLYLLVTLHMALVKLFFYEPEILFVLTTYYDDYWDTSHEVVREFGISKNRGDAKIITRGYPYPTHGIKLLEHLATKTNDEFGINFYQSEEGKIFKAFTYNDFRFMMLDNSVCLINDSGDLFGVSISPLDISTYLKKISKSQRLVFAEKLVGSSGELTLFHQHLKSNPILDQIAVFMNAGAETLNSTFRWVVYFTQSVFVGVLSKLMDHLLTGPSVHRGLLSFRKIMNSALIKILRLFVNTVLLITGASAHFTYVKTIFPNTKATPRVPLYFTSYYIMDDITFTVLSILSDRFPNEILMLFTLILFEGMFFIGKPLVWFGCMIQYISVDFVFILTLDRILQVVSRAIAWRILAELLIYSLDVCSKRFLKEIPDLVSIKILKIALRFGSRVVALSIGIALLKHQIKLLFRDTGLSMGAVMPLFHYLIFKLKQFPYLKILIEFLAKCMSLVTLIRVPQANNFLAKLVFELVDIISNVFFYSFSVILDATSTLVSYCYFFRKYGNVILYSIEGQEYGIIRDSSYFTLKNTTLFVGRAFLDPKQEHTFELKSFSSESFYDQSLLKSFENRGVLFNFAMDTDIYYLHSRDISFFFFDAYVGPVKDFYVMRRILDGYSLVLNETQKFTIHNPSTIDNMFVKQGMPFLFTSHEDFGLFLVVPIPKGEEERKYKFDFLKIKCTNKRSFAFADSLQRFEKISIIYWFVKFKYYTDAFEYLSSVFGYNLSLSDDEKELLEAIMKAKDKDIESSVESIIIDAWVRHILDQNEILFGKTGITTTPSPEFTRLVSTLDMVPSAYAKYLSSIIPDFKKPTHIHAFFSRFEDSSGKILSVEQGNSSRIQLQSKAEILNAIMDFSNHSMLENVELKHWYDYPPILESYEKDFISLDKGLLYLCELAKDSVSWEEFVSKLNDDYLNIIRLYLKKEQGGMNVFVELAHMLFTVFNADENICSRDQKERMFDKLKKAEFPTDVFDIYEKIPSPAGDIKIVPPIIQPQLLPDYENFLLLTKERLSSPTELFLSNCTIEVKREANLHGAIIPFLRKELADHLNIQKDPRHLARILLSSNHEELSGYFDVDESSSASLVDRLWSLFFSAYYCKNFYLKNNPICTASRPMEIDIKAKIFALIEFFTLYPLYPEQRTVMSNIVDKLMTGRSYVVQQGMAGGKTTRFGPVAALVATCVLRKLPIFVFPDSILDQNIAQLESWMMEYFGKKVFLLHTERSPKGYSEPYLRHLYYHLTMAHVNGDVMVCSARAIQCLLNARKELLVLQDKTSLEWVLRILHFIEKYSLLVLDEADEIMNTNVLYNFESGDPSKKDYGLYRHMADAFLLLKDKTIYHNKGQDVTIFQIEGTSLEKHELEQLRNNIINEIKTLNVDKNTHDAIVDTIVACCEKVRNVHYGLSARDECPYPIPYAMANTPREGSTFGNEVFLVGLALKYYLESELHMHPYYTQERIDDILEGLMDEETFIKYKTSGLTHLESFERLKSLIKDKDMFKRFFMNVIVESIKTSPHAYVSSCVEFLMASGQVLAYSGTFYNADHFRAIPNVEIDVSQFSIIENKIHKALKYKPLGCTSADYPEIHGLVDGGESKKSSSEQIEDLFAIIKQGDIAALFDAGALFKDRPNSAVASELLALGKHKCVLYYDERTNVLSYISVGHEGTGMAPLENQYEVLAESLKIRNDEIILYLDQAHCFGTNVDFNNLSARSIVVISTLVNTKILYQTLLRSRKLLNGIELSDKSPWRNLPRQQLLFFVSSVNPTHNVHLDAFDKKKLDTFLEPALRFKVNDTLATLFSSCHLRQIRDDHKQQQLFAMQSFFSHALKAMWASDISGGIPSWKAVLSLSGEQIEKIKWIFYSEATLPDGQSMQQFFSKDNPLFNMLFSGFDKSKIPDPKLLRSSSIDIEMVSIVETEQEQEQEQEQETIHDTIENNLIAWNTGFEPSSVSLEGLNIKFTEDFVSTLRGITNLNDTLSKPPVLTVLYKTKNFYDFERNVHYFATPYDSRRFNLPGLHYSSPPLLNIFDTDEYFDFEAYMHYLAYSGSIVGLMDMLDSQKELKPIVLSFVASKPYLLGQWRFFAKKWNNLITLAHLKRITTQFKKYSSVFTENAALKMKIIDGVLHLHVMPKNPSHPLKITPTDFGLHLEEDVGSTHSGSWRTLSRHAITRSYLGGRLQITSQQ